MNKTELLEVLRAWNPWARELDTGVPRSRHLARLMGFLKSRQVVTITGPRRAGKSFLMRQAVTELQKEGVNKNNILFVNLEDSRFARLDVRLLSQIYDTYLEFLAPEGEIFVFLDEAQEIVGWERWVRTMHELQKAKIVVSGSNAKLLSDELGTLLTGRHLDLAVYPLSFEEFLAFNKIELKSQMDIVDKRIEIQRRLRQYMENGGFPEVVLADRDQKEILLNHFDDLVRKDILQRFRIRKQQELKDLIRFYVSNIGTLTTYGSMEKYLKVTRGTIERFSGYLEQAFLFFFLKRFSFRVKVQEKDPRKVYAVDTGLSNVVGFRFSENVGRSAENVIFLELKRRQALNPELELFYWKDVHHREVDFVVKEGLKVSQLIQVCWNVQDFKTKERELRSLKKAMGELDCRNAVIVTEEYEGDETLNGNTVRYVPLWKWLLARKADDQGKVH
ncbi:MAG: ATP-binding protein [Acidobacteria bacterium]|nr:ATP-binding protein [Acidobacteriota bacterium]